MPSFDKYVEDVEQSKSVLEYDLWGRPTLRYSPLCGKSITGALDSLNAIEDLTSYETLNKANWICAFVFGGVALGYFIAFTIISLRWY